MAKPIPADARKELTDRASSAAQIGLVTLFPADDSDPIRLSTDPTSVLSIDPLKYGLVSRGQTYWYTALTIALPDSSFERMPATAVALDNISFQIVRAARSSIFQARMTLEVVLSSAPDVVIESWPGMNVTEATFDVDSIVLAVSYETFVGEPLHKYRLTRNLAPALRASS